MLADKAHLTDVVHSALADVIPGTQLTDLVVIIALGEGGCVLSPGTPLSVLQGQYIRWPRWLGAATGREADIVMRTIYDLYAALGDDSVHIQLHSHVNWSEFPALLAELRQFQHISGVPQPPAPKKPAVVAAGAGGGQTPDNDQLWVRDLLNSLSAPTGAVSGKHPGSPARYPATSANRTALQRAGDSIRTAIRRLGTAVRDLYEDIRDWIDDVIAGW